MTNIVNKDLTIKYIKASKNDEDKIPPIEPKEFLPQHPMRLYICGPSGSGKTMVLMNMLLRFYDKYFHKVYILSANYYDDKSYRALDGRLPEDQIVTDRDELEPTLNDIFSEQSEEENDGRRVLIVIDDWINEVRNSKAMKKIFTKGRAKGISIILVTQTFKGADPQIRNNCTDLIIFNVKNDELRKIAEDQSGVLSVKDFEELFKRAVKPSDGNPRPFLLIDNRTKDPRYKFRRNFDEILIP